MLGAFRKKSEPDMELDRDSDEADQHVAHCDGNSIVTGWRSRRLTGAARKSWLLLGRSRQERSTMFVVHHGEAGAARNNEKPCTGGLGVGAVVPVAALARHPKNSFLR
jgi:hypothetical protein